SWIARSAEGVHERLGRSDGFSTRAFDGDRMAPRARATSVDRAIVTVVRVRSSPCTIPGVEFAFRISAFVGYSRPPDAVRVKPSRRALGKRSGGARTENVLSRCASFGQNASHLGEGHPARRRKAREPSVAAMRWKGPSGPGWCRDRAPPVTRGSPTGRTATPEELLFYP